VQNLKGAKHMDFLQLAKNRYSVRNFHDKKVETEKLMAILEAGRVAPTACNNQPQKIIVAQTIEALEKIKKGYKDIYGAPLALIVCVDHDQTWKRNYDGKDSGDIDASIVTDHMMLCATEQGLGSLWIGAFDPVIIRDEFHIPMNIEPVNILLLGYASCEPRSPERHNQWRKPLAETTNCINVDTE
jgi:nitroreductase